MISVYASRYAIEAQQRRPGVQFTREELDYLPGINEDVMRVMRYLPGTASNSLSSRSHVRGGREDELAVYFDGAPLFEPFHFKDVQALLGILEPQSISTVDFYSGVFPVRYGNRISGVLDIEPRALDRRTLQRDRRQHSLYARAVTGPPGIPARRMAGQRASRQRGPACERSGAR